jgi:hypothetical protein
LEDGIMSSAGLVELARRFVACNDELESLREQIKLAVVNGAGEAAPGPFVGARSRPGAHPNALKAAEPEGRILELLKAGPLRAAEIAAAMAAKQSTTSERLRRLRQRGLIDLAGGVLGGDGLKAEPAAPSHEPWLKPLSAVRTELGLARYG